MCGIVGAVAARNVQPILLEGLKRLEYRGYDSAGIALFNQDRGKIERVRCLGKVHKLEEVLQQQPLKGHAGIAHTRWATHGKPSETNAHPHCSNEIIALVHNGIIENYDQLKQELVSQGYQFHSETDTEVIAHLLHRICQKETSMVQALQRLSGLLQGAYALAVMHAEQSEKIFAVRKGSPLVVGVGIEENYIASDPLAMLQVTDRFIFLKDHDVAEITTDKVTIYNQSGTVVERPVKRFEFTLEHADKGEFRHFMRKEIHQQPEVIADTLANRVGDRQILTHILGQDTVEILQKAEQIHIVACGTSYHAGLIAAYWFEQLAGIACQVETASEYRARQVAPRSNCLYLTISQSGETADTLAALRTAQSSKHYLTHLAICNVASSTLVREADKTIMTYAGIEIGVASTKAFTTQLCALLLLCLLMAKQRNRFSQQEESEYVECLKHMPELVQQSLKIEQKIMHIANKFADKHSTLFLGRHAMYPLAMEGALKLKEISYIHAEAYAGGELKHGPLALIDNNSIVVALLPDDALMHKMRANLEEVGARGGELIVFTGAEKNTIGNIQARVTVIPLNLRIHPLIAPIIYSLPLQLLAYHVALLKGADIDQPRNLAKSVTVE